MKTLAHLKNLLTAELGNEFKTQIGMIVDRTADYVEEWTPFEKDLPPVGEQIIVKTIHEKELHTFILKSGNIGESANRMGLVSWRTLTIKRQ
jgi:hypothetical protein